jgi:hypothetical protein
VRIRPKCGSTMRFGFVTITLFPWPTNWKNVVCLECRVTSISTKL